MQIRKAYEEALEQAQTGRGNMEFQVFVNNSSKSNLDYFEDNFIETVSKPEETFDRVRIRSNREKYSSKVKPQLLEKVELLYNDIFRRRDVKCWQDLLNNELTIDEYHYLAENAWNFFNNNYCLPYEVWKLIDAEFSISEDPRFRWAKFVMFDFGLPFDCFDPNLDIDYSSYAKFRFNAFEVFGDGDYQETVKLAQDAEKIYNGDYFIYKIKGISLYFLHNYDQAIESLSKALSLNDNDLELLLYRGNAFFKCGQYKKASVDFKIVLKKEKDNLEALKGMIMCLCNMKKYGLADKYFRNFIEKSPVGDIQVNILFEKYENERLRGRLRKVIKYVKDVNYKISTEHSILSNILVFVYCTVLIPILVISIFMPFLGLIFAGIIIAFYIIKYQSNKKITEHSATVLVMVTQKVVVDIMVNENIRKLWKISLSMTSIWGAKGDFEIIDKFHPFWKKLNDGKLTITNEILCGIPEETNKILRDRQTSDIRYFLMNRLQIYDENSFKNCLNYFFNGTDINRSFEEKRIFITALPDKERKALINSLSKNNKEYIWLSIVNQYYKVLPKAGILAYDISNCVSICRLGLYHGYLKESEFASYLDTLAIKAQENYSNFEEFGLASVVGLLYSMERIPNRAFDYDAAIIYYTEMLKLALTHPQSYWRNLDWKLDLS